MKYYQPRDNHRGYPLGGGYHHPGAELQRQRKDAEFARSLEAALDASGRREEYETLKAELKEAREAMAEACRRGPYPVRGEVADRYEEAAERWHECLREILP